MVHDGKRLRICQVKNVQYELNRSHIARALMKGFPMSPCSAMQASLGLLGRPYVQHPWGRIRCYIR
jgi:hypothetical protein